MLKLYSHPVDPASRYVRLLLAETGHEPELVREQVWERREAFLLLNPAGTLPVLEDDDGAVVCGIWPVTEYVCEALSPGGMGLMPKSPASRAETRRLIDWCTAKLDNEVTSYLVTEKVYKQTMDKTKGGGSPDASVLRAARANIRVHLRYFGYLLSSRTWLAGEQISFADLALAAHLSVADMLGEVPWDEERPVRDWYARMKSRPSFRPIFTETIRGIYPPAHYADPDF